MLVQRAEGPPCPRYLVGFDLRRRPHLESDVLVVGSGIAGFTAALEAAEAGCEVLLLTKQTTIESNSRYAQGGVAAVLQPDERLDDDTIDKHVADTLAAGAGLCDTETVTDLLSAAIDGIDLLRRYGCRFDRTTSGSLSLTREGGHSARRILHASGDATGREIIRCLTEATLAHPNITIVEDAFAIDLISDDEGIHGVLYSRRGEFYAALAGATIMATGGCGRVYRETTNPAIATGDGLAMAYRAGAGIADMEFMQFHPTTLYIAGGARLLITEAMRGEGAVLKNHDGEQFMQRYHELQDLAPRDIVSQSIVSEIRRTDFPHVWLDATHLGKDFLQERFPTIFKACQRFRIDISKDWIPVHPSAHYQCGGIRCDSHGRTDLPRLFAAGEVACTGLHGANRLASNSLLEGLVLGMRCGALAAEAGGPPGRVRLTSSKLDEVPEELDIADLSRSLRSMMWRDVGIERSLGHLQTAVRSIRFWADHQVNGFFASTTGWELQNMLVVAGLTTSAATARACSVGTHHRMDSHGSIDDQHLVYARPPGDDT